MAAPARFFSQFLVYQSIQFVIKLYVSLNNFSVMTYNFLSSWVAADKVSCSRTQHSSCVILELGTHQTQWIIYFPGDTVQMHMITWEYLMYNVFVWVIKWSRPLDYSSYSKIYFLISKQKAMLWVFHWGGSFEHPKHMLKLMAFMIITFKKDFFYFSNKSYVVGAQKNSLNETVLLSTTNTC